MIYYVQFLFKSDCLKPFNDPYLRRIFTVKQGQRPGGCNVQRKGPISSSFDMLIGERWFTTCIGEV